MSVCVYTCVGMFKKNYMQIAKIVSCNHYRFSHNFVMKPDCVKQCNFLSLYIYVEEFLV